jgi:hypothetical protein
MHIHGNEQPLHKRQNGAPPIPSAPGLSGGATTATNNPSPAGTGLVYNTAGGSAAPSNPGLVLGSSIVLTTTPIASPSASTLPAAESPATLSSGSSIPLGTVIGVCIGAFVVFLLLVLAGIWCYKHSGKRGGKSGSHSPMSASRNAQGDNERRRSRLEPWNRLPGEKEVDVWEGMVPEPASREIIMFPPTAIHPSARRSVDKLGAMFKSSPSLHSKASTSTSSDGHEFGDALAGSAQFAKYHPHLAEELAKTVTPIQANLARQEFGQAISWDGETVHGDDPFLSIHSRIDSSHLSSASEAMSANIVRPKNTPPATSSQPHRWESAEVLHYSTSDYTDEHEAKNPFADVEAGERKSLNNPFFNAQAQPIMKKPSNPFADHPKHHFTHLTKESNTSMSSTYSSDRAMQSLIAALDVSPEEIHERLRVASMQPSIQSTNSAVEDDASVAEFPLPPTQVPRF